MDFKTLNIGDIVAEDFRTAEVFKEHGLDFCCNGNQTISAACEKTGMDENKVYADLTALGETAKGGMDFNSWDLDFLADYIERTHHKYVSEKSPVILQYLNKLCQVHGEHHPELFEITKIFDEIATDMGVHMKREEITLFPFIRQMVKAKESGEAMEQPHFNTVERPVDMMMHDHSEQGDQVHRIEALSNNFTAPADGCNTYRVTYAMLKDFDNDLHTHIHLENNILFPKAVELEKQITYA